MSELDADVLIVGGGVIGLSCARYLQRAGRSVRVIDRGLVGGATSHGNCGTLTPSHAPPLAAPGVIAKGLRWMLQPDAPLYIRPRLDPALALWLLRFAARANRRDWWSTARAKFELLSQSRQMIESLVRDEALDCEFRASGLRYVYRSEAAFAADRAGLADLRELGVDWSLLDGAQLASAEPALLPGMAGSIHFPGDAQLRPERYTAELARRVREEGGEVDENREVMGLLIRSGTAEGIVTSTGEIRAREVLVALGPWSAGMLKSCGLRLPVQPGKGYSITYSRPGLSPQVPIVLRERSVCVTSWQDGFRLGSTMEFSGYDSSLNTLRLAALERGAGEYLRQPVGPQIREQWMGWRPMTYDDLPILGPAPGLRHLWLATGHGMMGMGMSAVTGQLLADLITGRQPTIDPRPTSAARFA